MSLEVEVQGELLSLLPEKAIYWKSRKALLIADLHLGKAGHFRKHGIAVPGRVEQNNLCRLSGLILE
jgi:metallophosphoesterase superfamily enzyme